MTDQLACTYAALLLHDSGIEITGDKIAAAVSAAGLEVRPTLPALFAGFFSRKSVSDLMTAAASSGSAAPAAAAAASAGAAPAAAAPAKKEEKKKEESDDEMGMGLFD